MIRPFKGTYIITQEHGVNPADYARFGLKGHNGVDYATPTGTPIIAPHSGVVIEAAFDQYGYGMYVKIENDKEGSILAHLKSFNVNPGDNVSEGQQIGISDNTGNSTGPHLHWGYFRKPRNKSDGFSGTTNPFQYLTENQETPQIPPEQKIECRDVENRYNDIIRIKDSRIQAMYLGLPDVDKTVTDVNQQTEAIAAYVLKTPAYISSIQEKLLIAEKNLKDIKEFVASK